MNTKDWEIEAEKCKASPYYFYTHYVTINGKLATTPLTEEEFNRQFNLPTEERIKIKFGK